MSSWRPFFDTSVSVRRFAVPMNCCQFRTLISHGNRKELYGDKSREHQWLMCRYFVMQKKPALLCQFLWMFPPHCNLEVMVDFDIHFFDYSVVHTWYLDVNTSYKLGSQFEKLSVTKMGKILKRYKIWTRCSTAELHVGVYAFANKNGSRKFTVTMSNQRTSRAFYFGQPVYFESAQRTHALTGLNEIKVILCRI